MFTNGRPSYSSHNTHYLVWNGTENCSIFLFITGLMKKIYWNSKISDGPLNFACSPKLRILAPSEINLWLFLNYLSNEKIKIKMLQISQARVT